MAYSTVVVVVVVVVVVDVVVVVVNCRDDVTNVIERLIYLCDNHPKDLVFYAF